jgi:hypothetical protein
VAAVAAGAGGVQTASMFTSLQSFDAVPIEP